MRWFIPKKIESQNKFAYSHWRKYQKYARQWEDSIGWIMRDSTLPASFRNIYILSIRKRLIDEGNLVGGAKPLPDALKKFGWIVDDSPKWCKIKYEQRKIENSKEAEGTWIEIEIEE